MNTMEGVMVRFSNLDPRVAVPVTRARVRSFCSLFVNEFLYEPNHSVVVAVKGYAESTPSFLGKDNKPPGGARSVQDRTACSNSERAGAVGLRWQAVFGSSANGKASHPEIRDSMSRSCRVHLLQNRSHLVPFSSRPGAAYEIQK